MSYEDRGKPCGICQSESFIWGDPKSRDGVWFKPEANTGQVLGEQSGLEGHGLIVRACVGCGNVQWFLKYFPASEKKKKNDE